ncbi:hypothetical protein F4775DRAFT_436964 [Biscogniauxia sp. FL1348]|nr:hypothetical protein F4775DRAFT_436964 [Biscogniauxia sp. FL1348]
MSVPVPVGNVSGHLTFLFLDIVFLVLVHSTGYTKKRLLEIYPRGEKMETEKNLCVGMDSPLCNICAYCLDHGEKTGRGFSDSIMYLRSYSRGHLVYVHGIQLPSRYSCPRVCNTW